MNVCFNIPTLKRCQAWHQPNSKFRINGTINKTTKRFKSKKKNYSADVEEKKSIYALPLKQSRQRNHKVFFFLIQALITSKRGPCAAIYSHTLS